MAIDDSAIETEVHKWINKGNMLFESGKYADALREYDRSIEINPMDETVWNNRGLTLVKLNRLSEAIESYDKALELNPTVEKIWSNKGLALAKMKQTGEYIDLQKIATTLQKEEAETETALQVLVPVLSEAAPEKPICYEKALEIDPDDYIHLNNKGNALYKMGDFKTALKTFGLAFEKNPENMTSIRGMELCIKSLKKTMK